MQAHHARSNCARRQQRGLALGSAQLCAGQVGMGWGAVQRSQEACTFEAGRCSNQFCRPSPTYCILRCACSILGPLVLRRSPSVSMVLAALTGSKVKGCMHCHKSGSSNVLAVHCVGGRGAQARTQEQSTKRRMICARLQQGSEVRGRRLWCRLPWRWRSCPPRPPRSPPTPPC